MTNWKQMMLDAVCGKPVPRIPWVPRLDLWYNAHRRAGTLPPRYARATLAEITDDLGWGYHAVIPDFRDLRTPADAAHRAIGILNLAALPYRTVLEEVDVQIEQRDDRMIVTYRTPKGELSTVTVYDEEMRRAGVTTTHVERQAFKGPADYDALCWLFEHAQAEPTPEGYAAYAHTVGDRGFTTAWVNGAASPMHLIQRDLMPLDTFFFELHDHPEQVQRLVEAIGGYWRQMLAAGAACAADVLLLGSNYDSAIQYPGFFAQHILPGLADFADQLHRRGKFLLTHTDGENTGLLAHYLAAKFDIADSICPHPMTRLTLGQIREVLGDRITIMGGIPAVALLPDSMSDRRFEQFLDGLFEQIGSGRHLILGISDTTPPDADFNRLLRIARRIEEFGRPRELAA